jgi:hypothetical protein
VMRSEHAYETLGKKPSIIPRGDTASARKIVIFDHALMNRIQNSFESMPPERQTQFVARLVDLIGDGNKGDAIRLAGSVGLKNVPSDPNDLLTYLRELGSQNTTKEVRAALLEEGISALKPPSVSAGVTGYQALPAPSDLFGMARNVMGEKAPYAIGQFRLRAGSVSEFIQPYSVERNEGFGAVLVRKHEGIVEVYQLEINKKPRSSMSSDSIRRHDNFCISFKYVDEGNQVGDISISPRVSLNESALEGPRSSGYRSLLTEDGKLPNALQLVGQYSFGAQALLARLFDSPVKAEALRQFNASRVRDEDHAKKEFRRSNLRLGSGEEASDAAAFALPAGAPLAALTGKLLMPVLDSVRVTLREELKMMIDNGDFKKILSLANDTPGITPDAGEEWRIVPTSVYSISAGFRGSGRS